MPLLAEHVYALAEAVRGLHGKVGVVARVDALAHEGGQGVEDHALGLAGGEGRAVDQLPQMPHGGGLVVGEVQVRSAVAAGRYNEIFQGHGERSFL